MVITITITVFDIVNLAISIAMACSCRSLKPLFSNGSSKIQSRLINSPQSRMSQLQSKWQTHLTRMCLFQRKCHEHLTRTTIYFGDLSPSWSICGLVLELSEVVKNCWKP